MKTMARSISLYLGLLFMTVFITSSAAQNDGLYVTNGSSIFLMKNTEDDMAPTIVYQQADARIVGLALDIEDNVIFWSDISPGFMGIYKASLNIGQQLKDVTKIVKSDVVEINGLAVDWESKNIYWTDAKKKTIEVSNYNGEHRRVLSVSGLVSPRGIYCDPVSGFLFWNDQGRKVISRSRPDGSQQETIVSTNVHLPNQIIVYRSALYWVDSLDKEIWRSELDGTKKEKLGSVASVVLASNIFGIALDPTGRMYVSAWERGAVIALNLLEGDKFKMSPLVPYQLGSAMFSLAYYGKRNLQPAASNPCDPNRMAYGCSHLCLPTGPQTARCSCPSYGGLVLSSDRKNCKSPQHVLVYASGYQGSVEYIDADNRRHPDRYMVGRSLRPVGVTYDPIKQMVYWSDVHERRIHQAKLDGSEHSILLDMADGVGIVDGLAVDYVNRMLYYSNLGVVKAKKAPYDWHQIEAVDLDTKSVRVIVTDVEKPRALWVDSANRHLYYSDWGSAAKVVRTNLDGSDPVTLKSGFDNPNGITVSNGQVFVVDSHYKTRQEGNPRYPANPNNGSMSSMNNKGENWQEWEIPYLQMPFAITSNPRVQQFYISDWDTKSIVTLTLSKTRGWTSPEAVVENVESPMGVVFSIASLTNIVSSPCDSDTQGCDDMCFVSSNSQSEGVCACSSYHGNVLGNDLHNCNIPEEFLMFVDMNRIKLIGYDSGDQSLYNVLSGSSNISNFVAMAYDSAQKGVYYSEVGLQTRRGIYFSKLDGSKRRTVYTGNSVIDGLALHTPSGSLYWTDVLAGQIITMATSGDLDTYKVVVDGLSSPRAIKLDMGNGYIYWSEVGARPRVARKRLTGLGGTETLLTDGLREPNGLELDVKMNKMYIGDGFYKKIFICELEGMGCEEMTTISGVPEHIFSVAKYDKLLYYSDWERGSVTQVNMDTGRITHVAQNLMRPTNMVLQYDIKPRACPSDNPCSYQCHANPDGYFCLCPQGETLDEDDATCVKGMRWEMAHPNVCGSPCRENEVCARQVGGSTVQYRCQCKPGYYMRTLGTDKSCKACDVNKFKPNVGNDDKCKFCPQTGVITPEGSSGCLCRSGEYWNIGSEICTVTKEGACPTSVSARFQCQSRSCTSDKECHSVQKCCPLLSQCGGNQCTDPTLDKSRCVHDNQVYKAGDTFKPDMCTDCQCAYLKGALYAQTVCIVRECPILVCTTDQQMLPPDSCCPICIARTAPPVAIPNITIENCPQGRLVNLTLARDTRWAKHSSYIQPYDRTGLDRSINITKVPSGAYYRWTGGTVDVRWTAAALRPSGEWDVAICSYKVKVNDSQPPVMECPGDIHVYISNKSIPVTWVPPTASDNVGVLTNYPRLTRGGRWGSAFSIGEHTVTYVAKDTASNEASCSFNISVYSLSSANCAVISPLNGRFDCYDANKGIVACNLQCNKDLGFVMNPKYNGTHRYDCSKGRWLPKLPEYYMVDSCVEIVPKIVTVNLVMNLKQCLEGFNEKSAGFDLETRVQKYKLNHAKFSVASDVTFTAEFESSCEGSGNSSKAAGIKATLTLKGMVGTKSSERVARTELKQKMDDIKQAILRGSPRLVRPISVQSHQYSRPVTPVMEAEDVDGLTTEVELGCAEGQESINEGCLICPSGTHRGLKGCNACDSNTYQGIPGQITCEPCPNGTFSGKASYAEMQCVACVGAQCGRKSIVTTNPTTINWMLIGIIVGVTAAVIAIIVIVTVVCVVKKRRAAARAKKQQDSEMDFNFANPVYGETQVSMNQAATNNIKKKRSAKDKGSIRSTMSSTSTASAMARAYPDMPEKEVEFTIDDKGKVDLLANKY